MGMLGMEPFKHQSEILLFDKFHTLFSSLFIYSEMHVRDSFGSGMWAVYLDGLGWSDLMLPIPSQNGCPRKVEKNAKHIIT